MSLRATHVGYELISGEDEHPGAEAAEVCRWTATSWSAGRGWDCFKPLGLRESPLDPRPVIRLKRRRV